MHVQKIASELSKYKTTIVEDLSAGKFQHFDTYFKIGEKFAAGDFGTEFRSKFRKFYAVRGMNGPQIDKFFQLFASSEDDLKTILLCLQKIPGRKGPGKIHFSFSTKLLHTKTVTLPIYDERLRSVLGLPRQLQTGSVDEKIYDRIAIYETLKEISKTLLTDSNIVSHLKSIRAELASKAARENFLWQNSLLSEQKLLDSVLWALYQITK